MRPLLIYGADGRTGKELLLKCSTLTRTDE